MAISKETSDAYSLPGFDAHAMREKLRALPPEEAEELRASLTHRQRGKILGLDLVDNLNRNVLASQEKLDKAS